MSDTYGTTCSAKDSCYVCTRIFARWEEFYPQAEGNGHPIDPIHGREILTVAVWANTSQDRHYVQFAKPIHDADDPCGLGFNPYMKFDTLEIIPRSIPAPEHLRSLSNNTSMSSCGKQVLEWINHCSESHPACAQIRQSDWYPTRLLDLGSSAGHDSRTSVRLIETRDARPTGPYVTLSHCWGDAAILKLEKELLTQFKEGISIKQLPRTFVDAIAVARYLQVRYIWIDSLTIIQDDGEDWVRESVSMGQVYQNSFCNIGATGSSNSHGGLFFARKPEFVLPTLAVLNGQQVDLDWDADWDGLVHNQNLMRRAWVVQERWLCPRMLHFCRDQVYWECKTGAASESSSELSSEDTISLAGRPTKSDTATTLAERWDWMVYFYSRGNLTFASDKLVAFSGMARAMQRVVGDRYVAGLWVKDFIFHLTWSMQWELTMTSPYRPKEYVAPSWSWASVNGSTRFLGWWRTKDDKEQIIRETATVSSIHLEYTDFDPFGRVKDGNVRMWGPLMNIKWNNQGDIYHQDSKLAAYTQLDVWPDDDEQGMDLVYLGLYLTATKSAPDDCFEATGLLLQEVTGSVGVFSRVGLCRIIDSSRHLTAHHEQTAEQEELDTKSTEFMSELVHPTRIGSLPDELFNPQRGYAITII
jgi:hypothetical protein